MRVKNLVSWAGDNFSYLPDEDIDLDDATAEARIEAGVCERLGAAPPATVTFARTPNAADVEIPDAFAKLSAADAKDLAAALASPAAKTRNEAIEVIEAELVLRAA